MDSMAFKSTPLMLSRITLRLIKIDIGGDIMFLNAVDAVAGDKQNSRRNFCPTTTECLTTLARKLDPPSFIYLAQVNTSN